MKVVMSILVFLFEVKFLIKNNKAIIIIPLRLINTKPTVATKSNVLEDVFKIAYNPNVKKENKTTSGLTNKLWAAKVGSTNKSSNK